MLMSSPALQRSFDDLGTPLAEVTFCIVDVETNGGHGDRGALTEIGAVRVRGGVELDRFQSLINPCTDIPPFITALTGISNATVANAPTAQVVLPVFRAFLDDAVMVAHNIRFDAGMLNAQAARLGMPTFSNRRVDTLALARRLLRPEVPNCKLATLAQALNLDHQPSHRALDDALATVDLLHALIERAAGWGVLGLDDLIALPKLAGHPSASKLALTNALPRLPGVYLMKDRSGRVLYVGKASNLHARVRSYFTSDNRPKVPELLRQLHRIDHDVAQHPLEAAVNEIRLIQRHDPPFNRHGRSWRRAAYVKLTNDAFPRLVVGRTQPNTPNGWLGPLRSATAARQVADAITSVVPLRQCTTRVKRGQAPCLPAQLGTATCPCSGAISTEAYNEMIATVQRGLVDEPQVLLDPLQARLADQASAQLYELAAQTRDHLAALSDAMIRQRRLATWSRPARLVVEHSSGVTFTFRHGLLVEVAPAGGLPLALASNELDPAPSPNISHDVVAEVLIIASTLERHADEFRIVHADGELSCALPRIRT